MASGVKPQSAIKIEELLKPQLPTLLTGLINEESKGEERDGKLCPNCMNGGGRREELSELAISSFVIEISIMPKEKPVCYDREH